jgi:plastocyanin
MRKIVILLASVTILVTGCGGGSSSTSAGSNTPVKLSGSTTNKGSKDLTGSDVTVNQEDFAFNPTFIKGGTPGATITVHLKNIGSNPHTFTSTTLGVDKTLSPGATADVQVTLPQSGASEFHCKFHQASNGMQGAFFFKDGDTVTGAGGAPASSSSSSSYNYN